MTIQLYSQNLVPNPSFEEYDSAGVLVSVTYNFDGLENWFGSSMQYYNTDFNHLLTTPPPWDPTLIFPLIGVPLNTSGFQYSRTGKGIVRAAESKFYREWPAIKLKEKLEAGQIYCVTYHLSLNHDSGKIQNKNGAYFSPDSIIAHPDSLYQYYEIIPQIISFEYFTDTALWYSVKGSFIANGEENFLFLGAFGQPDTIGYIDNIYFDYYPGNFAVPNEICAFYFDDVSVYPCNAEVFIAKCREDTSICLGDSVQIGTHNLEDYLYWWTPHEGIDSANSYSQVAKPWVKPTQTTTYYLTVKDFKFDESYDSVTITINNCDVNANAGTDKEICKGESVKLGTINIANHSYKWTPDKWLDNPNTATPTTTPTTSISYVVSAIGITGITTYDTVFVNVKGCELLYIPNTFTPNGDNINDVFEFTIDEQGLEITTTIYNAWGEDIYTFNGLSGWDGKGAQDGKYAYHITVVQNKITTEYSGIINIKR
jgi:gliding motility-associated-like protein